MIRYFFVIIFLIFTFSSSVALGAKPMANAKKFTNPATKFVGRWRVESYDFRAFLNAPEDIEAQIKAGEEVSAFPVGQIIEFQSLGAEVMPGTINPTTMTSTGPTGEVLAMILEAPFAQKLCTRPYWKSACEAQEKPIRREVMITDIVNWWKDAPPKYRALWADLEPLEYTFNHLGKQFSMEAWVAKNGDILFELLLKGNGLDGKPGGVAGVRLKRIK